jgi:hypothetical protein
MSRTLKFFICAYIAAQLIAPLWYYAGSGDKNDERFAWRMFSSVRMIECRVEFRTGPAHQPVQNLGSRFHEAWINLAKRGRIEVITAMAEALCAGGEEDVRAELSCKTAGGRLERRGGSWNICELGTL